MADRLEMINAALIESGSDPILDDTEVSTQNTVANALYDFKVKAEMARKPWRFCTKEHVPLTLLAGEREGPLKFKWQMPSGVFRVQEVLKDGYPTSNYTIVGDKIWSSCNIGVTINYTYLVEEANWPPDFEAAMIKRLEAAFWRVAEELVEARKCDKDADVLFRLVASSRSAQQPGRKLSDGPLVGRRLNG